MNNMIMNDCLDCHGTGDDGFDDGQCLRCGRTGAVPDVEPPEEEEAGTYRVLADRPAAP